MDGAGVSFAAAGNGRLQNGLRYQGLDRGLQCRRITLAVSGMGLSRDVGIVLHSSD